MKKHINISIKGRVQGVGFRYSTLKKAKELGIYGFVKNMPDRSVYIEAEADKKTLEKFTKWCNEGPPFSRVDSVIVSESNLNDFKKFEIF